MGSKMGAADPNYPKIQGLSRLSRLSYGIAAPAGRQVRIKPRKIARDVVMPPSNLTPRGNAIALDLPGNRPVECVCVGNRERDPVRNGEIHRLSVLLFTDIVDSVHLQERLGTNLYANLLNRHDALFREAMSGSSGRILKHTGDGFLAEFSMSSEAVATSLRFQRLLHEEPWDPEPIAVRVGLHQGEVLVIDPGNNGEAAPIAVGMAVNLAARVMDLALAKQILITRPVYENARYYLKDQLEENGTSATIRWIFHGPYTFKGQQDPMDVLEVGFEGMAPFTAPAGGLKSRPVKPVPEVAEPVPVNLAEIGGSDVFISYACLDDEPLAEGESGWVTRLHDALRIRLGQLLGRQPRVWRDPKPDRRDTWHPEMESRLPSVRTLVPIISPPYLQTSACQRELRTYGERCDESQHLIQVVKAPAEEDHIPIEARDLLALSPRIEFFEVNSDGQYQQFDASLGDDHRRRFLHGVYDLAYEITKRVSKPRESVFREPDQTVFLAETTFDLRDVRDRIKRELQERGYRVLPECPLPLFADELTQRVRSEIRQANAVVHLIGSRYGIVPEGSDRSLVELQCRLSAEALENASSFARFFWAPKPLGLDDPRQEAFFNSLDQGEFGMRRTEFVRGSLEELKRLTLARLNGAPSPPEMPINGAKPKDEASIRMIYLICDPADQETVEPIEDHLFELGYEVKVSPIDGDAKLRTETHREILTLCDAALIYFGHGSHQWVEMTLMDILKAPAFGRQKPLEAQAVYVAPPFNRRKDRFRTRSAIVLRGDDETFHPDHLTPFLDALGPPTLTPVHG